MEDNQKNEEIPEVQTVMAALSPEVRELLEAVQESPYRLTTSEQFQESPANTEYFILEPNIRKVEDVGWRYLAQHLDVLLSPELLDAIDPVPFGQYAIKEEQGHFSEHGYISLSGDPWQHDRSLEQEHREPEKKTSIRDRLEQGKKECAKHTPARNGGKSEPER